MSVLSFGLYFFLSSAAMCANISYACYTREQFYPIVLFLVTSKISFLITANMVVALTGLIGKIMKSIFFGKLRDTEVEQLIDRLRYSVAETGLALTTFRAELSPVVLLMFLLLIYVKSFHWLCRSRIDYLEQVVPVPLLPHIRIQSLLVSLLCLDFGVFYYCAITTKASGKSVLILFGFEFVVLFISAINAAIRYILILIDSYYEAGMNYKGFYTMLLDVISDGLRFVVYVAFFSLIFIHYDLPIHIIRYDIEICICVMNTLNQLCFAMCREVWMSFLAFQQRLASLYRYLRLIRRLDDRLPDASAEELAAAGNCLICREGMTAGKKLSCSHVFHADCLRMWLQHQQSCPLCRADINIPSDTSDDVPATVVAAAAAAAAAPVAGDAPEVGAAPAPEPERRAEPSPRRTPRASRTQTPQPASASGTPYDASPRKARTPGLAASDLPGFFQILTDPYVIVRSAPHSESPQCGIIPEGTVVFCTTRLTPLGGPLEPWLRVPEGWIPERNALTLRLNLRPVGVQDAMDHATSPASLLKPSSAVSASKLAPSLSSPDGASRGLHISPSSIGRSPAAVGSADRARLVLDLQARVESMGYAMQQMQESLAVTQLSLMQLAQGI